MRRFWLIEHTLIVNFVINSLKVHRREHAQHLHSTKYNSYLLRICTYICLLSKYECRRDVVI